jgi:hypothetical protein
VHDVGALERAQACLLGLLSAGNELGLTLARQLVFRGAFDQESVAAAYAAWYHGWTHSLEPEPCSHAWCRPGPSEVDPFVAAALDAVTADDVRERRSASIVMASANPASDSRSALARVAPIGIWGAFRPIVEVAAAARLDAQLTHPNAACESASMVLSATIATAIRYGLDAHDTYRFALDHANHEEVRRALAAAQSMPPPSGNGSALASLQGAFFRLLHASDFQSDACTGSTGALVGAVYGRARTPEQQQRMLLSCRPMAGHPGVHRPRPALYWPNDALVIAERLLTPTLAAG